MAAKANKKESGFWHFVDNFQGDKIILMIVFLLILISILAISSSTPLLAIQQHSTRSEIIGEQLLVAALGIGIIFLVYNIKHIGFFRIISQLGYAFSLVLLVFLAFKVNLGFMKAVEINGAVRAVSIMGFQLHVFEVVKIAMIMYLAWAVNAWKNDDFKIVNALSKIPRLEFLGKQGWKLFIYIFFPVISVCVLLLNGSVSSALFIGLIMFATILIGGVKIKDMFIYGVGLVAVIALCVMIYFGSGGEHFKRVGTAIERITRASEDPEEKLLSLPRGSREFQETLDVVRQPISAKVAVSEGGLIGKGPGRSTQRYIVPVMFEDYMFSFIVEEYGLFGAFIILVLYGSLLARGTVIVKNCDNEFAKTAVAGLIILITGQAVMHMLINVDLGPLTGQTLPMISHGNSSFLAFSLAFGIILSISRMAKKKIEKATMQEEPIVEHDEIKESLSDLDQL